MRGLLYTAGERQTQPHRENRWIDGDIDTWRRCLVDDGIRRSDASELETTAARRVECLPLSRYACRHKEGQRYRLIHMTEGNTHSLPFHSPGKSCGEEPGGKGEGSAPLADPRHLPWKQRPLPWECWDEGSRRYDGDEDKK